MLRFLLATNRKISISAKGFALVREKYTNLPTRARGLLHPFEQATACPNMKEGPPTCNIHTNERMYSPNRNSLLYSSADKRYSWHRGTVEGSINGCVGGAGRLVLCPPRKKVLNTCRAILAVSGWPESSSSSSLSFSPPVSSSTGPE